MPRWSDSFGQLRAVERLHQKGVETVELRAPDCWLEVDSRYLFVSLPPPPTQRVPDGVEPLVEVVHNLQVLRVVHQPGVPLRYDFAEFVRDIFPRLAGDVPLLLPTV